MDLDKQAEKTFLRIIRHLDIPPEMLKVAFKMYRIGLQHGWELAQEELKEVLDKIEHT